MGSLPLGSLSYTRWNWGSGKWKTLPKARCKRLYHILKGSAQKITGTPPIALEGLFTWSHFFILLLSWRWQAAPCVQSAGRGAKAEMYFPFTQGTFHTEESSAQELLAEEHLGEGAAQAVLPGIRWQRQGNLEVVLPQQLCGTTAPPPAPVPQKILAQWEDGWVQGDGSKLPSGRKVDLRGKCQPRHLKEEFDHCQKVYGGSPCWIKAKGLCCLIPRTLHPGLSRLTQGQLAGNGGSSAHPLTRTPHGLQQPGGTSTAC